MTRRLSRSRSRVPATIAVCAIALGAAHGSAAAQLITPKTVPIAQGDQFNIFPSSHPGLGGVSIALGDSLGDGWSNPARMTRAGEPRLFSAPFFYSISSGGGSGRTLPIGVMGSTGEWSGGVVGAIQQLNKGQVSRWSTSRVSDRSAVNQFIAAALAKRIGTTGISVGGSAFGASLDAMDGVDLLYGNATRVDQVGGMTDVRLGISKECADARALDAVLLYDRFDMTHDAIFEWTTWEPFTSRSVRRDSIAHNQDRTVTWGAHLRYVRPLTTTGWQVGWIGTFNKLEHPKIPNYDIMSVPRDPGSTRAFNFGVGLSRVRGPSSFGIDVIYEPMMSETWADAARDTAIVGGGTILAGDKTIENDFTFSNSIVRLGVGQEVTVGGGPNPTRVDVQLGMAMRSIDYRLWQVNNITRSHRKQQEDWVEWSPTLGVTARFAELELHYNGRFVFGVNRPGNWGPEFVVGTGFSEPRAGGIIVAPSAPIAMSPVHVTQHQISVSLPIR